MSMIVSDARVAGRVGIAAVLAALLLALTAGHAVAQRPTFALAKPHPFAQQSDAGNQFIQVAVRSGGAAGIGTEANPIRGIETKVAHDATILAPANSQASYSYSVGGFTPAVNGVRYWLQMGYIVLASDGGGLARWFTQVNRCTATCTTTDWKLSRKGEANPPPACAACSGDAGHGGYPFAVTSDTRGTWTFWFDGLKKNSVSLGSAYSTIDPVAVYFIGEATAPTLGGANAMVPRGTIRTLRLWSGPTGWVEPASATAVYHASVAGTVVCPPYDVRFTVRQVDTYIGAPFNRVEAGAIRQDSAGCTGAGSAVW